MAGGAIRVFHGMRQKSKEPVYGDVTGHRHGTAIWNQIVVDSPSVFRVMTLYRHQTEAAPCEVGDEGGACRGCERRLGPCLDQVEPFRGAGEQAGGWDGNDRRNIFQGWAWVGLLSRFQQGFQYQLTFFELTQLIFHDRLRYEKLIIDGPFAQAHFAVVEAGIPFASKKS